MREFLLRILKTGVPTALILGGLGYVLSIYAGNLMANHQVPRRANVENLGNSPTPYTGKEVSGQLSQTLPFSMAAWGLIIVVVLEGLRSIWVKPVQTLEEGEHIPIEAMPKTVDELLNQLAVRVEAEARLSGTTFNPNREGNKKPSS